MKSESNGSLSSQGGQVRLVNTNNGANIAEKGTETERLIQNVELLTREVS